MSIELPTLRIGLAGFTLEQTERLRQLLPQASPSGLAWEFGKFSESDVLWINGARSQLLAGSTLRIASGVPGGRSLQVQLGEVDRPLAFGLPLPRNLEAPFTFDPASVWSVGALLEQLETVLRPLISQFCLGSQILEQETALGAGVYHVTSGTGALLAVVNLRGEVAVAPAASALDFESAMWTLMPGQAGEMPAGFVRISLSLLMWQYAVRTTRDALPRRYRTELLYFRRPPRLPQRLLRDSHLLLLRELAVEPGTFIDLQQRTGLVGAQLAHELAALYLVGSITSNPRRASQLASQRWADDAESMQGGLDQSVMPSDLGPDSKPAARPVASDLTAPVPLSFD